MTIGGVQSAMIGFALFDAWSAGMRQLDQAGNHPASPLIAAAFQAFENYVETEEAVHTGMIAGAAYTLNANAGGAQLITKQQMAPLLALNLFA